MPFITAVTFSAKFLFRPVTISNVTEFLLVSCTDIITLSAEIIGELTGHEYHWEQTGGPAVTWLEPQDQLMVTFQKPATTDDLFFRFWVDKGTGYEQYKDTIISGQARDDVSNYTIVGETPGYIKNFTSGSDIDPGITYPNLVPGISPNGVVTYDNPVKTLTWANPSPTAPLYYVKTDIYISDSGNLTLLGEFPKPISSYSDQSINQPNVTSTYVFRSYYDLYNAGQFTYTTDVVVQPFINNHYLDTSEDVYSNLTYEKDGGISTFQTQILELVPLIYDESISTIDVISGRENNISDYQTQILSLVILTDEIEDTPVSALNISTAGNIGIFQIQTSTGITVI